LSNNEKGKKIIVAVVGQPNVGKSTLFNILTRKHVIVANWPGVTVEKHEGWRDYKGYRIHFVDLPGIYGFSASTLEEIIARNYILSGEPDVLLVLVDSTMPERTMYLALEALEIFPKTIIVFTKSDLTHTYGIHINYRALSRILNVPVVAVSAATKTGINELLETIIKVFEGKIGRKAPLKLNYGALEPFVRDAEELIKLSKLSRQYPSRWLAVRALQGDKEILDKMKELGEKELVEKIMKIRSEIENIFKRSVEEVFAQIRFSKLAELMERVVVRAPIKSREVYVGIDRLFSHPIIGPIVSLSILLMIFAIIFTLNTGFPLNIIFYSIGYGELAEFIEEHSLGGLLEEFFEWLGGVARELLHGFPNWFVNLVVDGIIGGVGAVLVFLPLIFLVALLLALLEDSGLAPRIAMSLHSLLQRIGFSGHAIFPVMLGLGCNVPAIMASRSSPNFRERLRLIMTLAFIPCQARLVVVLGIASALSGIKGLILVVASYITAFIIFAFIGKLLYEYDRKRGYVDEPELLLEIPPLHRPLGKVVWWLTWNTVRHFIIKAGTIIFLVTMISWVMLNYSAELKPVSSISDSLGASIAKVFSPLLYPMGFTGETAWKIAYALMIGFLAKEAIIGALAILTGAESSAAAIRMLGLSEAQIVSLTMFSMLYVPCLATMAVICLESRSVKIMLTTVLIMMVIAYIASILAYVFSLIFLGS